MRCARSQQGWSGGSAAPRPWEGFGGADGSRCHGRNRRVARVRKAARAHPVADRREVSSATTARAIEIHKLATGIAPVGPDARWPGLLGVAGARGLWGVRASIVSSFGDRRRSCAVVGGVARSSAESCAAAARTLAASACRPHRPPPTAPQYPAPRTCWRRSLGSTSARTPRAGAARGRRRGRRRCSSSSSSSCRRRSRSRGLSRRAT